MISVLYANADTVFAFFFLGMRERGKREIIIFKRHPVIYMFLDEILPKTYGLRHCSYECGNIDTVLS